MEKSWIFRLLYVALINILININFSENTVFRYTDDDEDYLRVIDKSNLRERIHERLKRSARRSGNEKRSSPTSTLDDSIVSYHVFPNDSNNVAFIFWKHADTSVIFILTCQYANTTNYNKHSNKGCKSKSNFYRSTDHGKSFRLMTKDMSDAHLHSIYLSPIDKKFIVLTDFKNRTVYITNDEGKSFKKYPVSFSPTFIHFHPTRVNYILAYDNSDDGDNALHVSDNRGVSWKRISTKVRNYFWGRVGYEIDDRLVFVEKESDKQIDSKTVSSFLYASIPPYFPNNTRVIYNQHLVPFSVYVGNAFIVTQRWHDRNLYIASGLTNFVMAKFDKQSKAHVMHVVITDENNEILLAIIHPDFRASLYLSDHTGANFILRQSDILTEAIKSVVMPPKMDFYKVKGVFGTYIANTRGAGTSITFDKGYTWSKVTCDTKDVAGNLSGMRNGKKCDLFLYLKIEHPFSDFTAPIFSKASAPGIIIAQGFNYRTKPIGSNHQVFMSIDGGYTWKKTLSTWNGYVILDHGGLVAATPLKFTVNHRLSYTTDYGQKWHSLHLTRSYSRIAAIITESTARLLMINVFGFLQISSTWIVWKIDFSKLLKRSCNKGDYIKWNHNYNTCVMGEKSYSMRRKASSRCVSGPNFNNNITKVKCECTHWDFGCDKNYYRIKKGNRSVCIPVNPKHFDRDICKHGGTYLKTKGYKKLYGDKCINGIEKKLSPERRKCVITKPGWIAIKASSVMEAVNKEVIFYIKQLKGFYNVTYSWKFPDQRNEIKGSYMQVKEVKHKFSSSGKYNVTLTASNSAGKSTASIIVEIIDNLYVNAFILYNKPVIVNVPEEFTLKTVDENGTVKSIGHLPSTKFMWSFDGVYMENADLMDAKHTFSKPGNSKVEVQILNPISYQTISETLNVYHNGVVVDLSFSAQLENLNPKTKTWIMDFGKKLKTFLSIKYDLEGEASERLGVRGNRKHPTEFSIIFVDSEKSLNTMSSASVLSEKISRDINLHAPLVEGYEDSDVRIVSAKIRGSYSAMVNKKSSSKYIWVYVIFIIIIIVVVALSMAYLHYRRKGTLWCLKIRDGMNTQLVVDMDEESEFEVHGQQL